MDDAVTVCDPGREERRASARRELRRRSNLAGIILMLTLIVMYGTARLYRVFAAPFFRSALPAELLTGPFFENISELILTGLYYLVTVPILGAFCNRRSGVRYADMLHFPKLPAGGLRKLLLMGFGVMYPVAMISDRIIDRISALFHMLFGVRPQIAQPSVAGTDILSVVVLIVGTALLAPFFEELFSRGSMVGLFGPFGGIFTAVVTGVTFGFLHTNVNQVPYAIAMGIYAGFVAYRTGSLWPTILLHISVNGIAVTETVLESFLPSEFSVSDLLWNLLHDPGGFLSLSFPLMLRELLSLAVFALTIVGIVVLIREICRNPREFTLPEEKAASVLTAKEKARAFFCAPAVIAFFSLSICLAIYNAFFR